MKRISVITVVVFIQAVYSFGQNHYYWSGGEKLFLKESTDKYIVESSFYDALFLDKQIKEGIVKKVVDIKNKLKLVNTVNCKF